MSEIRAINWYQQRELQGISPKIDVLLEQMLNGNVSELMFKKLMSGYEEKQEKLTNQRLSLKTELNEIKDILGTLLRSSELETILKHSIEKRPHNTKQNTPYNIYRKDEILKKVVLTIKQDKQKLKERMCLSEHPFGTVKWHHGAHYLLCIGKEKATAELGLSFLAYWDAWASSKFAKIYDQPV